MYLSLAVNGNGDEVASNRMLYRYNDQLEFLNSKKRLDKSRLQSYDEWTDSFSMGPFKIPTFNGLVLPPGTIEKLTGRKLTWKDRPIRLKVRDYIEDDDSKTPIEVVTSQLKIDLK